MKRFLKLALSGLGVILFSVNAMAPETLPLERPALTSAQVKSILKSPLFNEREKDKSHVVFYALFKKPTTLFEYYYSWGTGGGDIRLAQHSYNMDMGYSLTGNSARALYELLSSTETDEKKLETVTELFNRDKQIIEIFTRINLKHTALPKTPSKERVRKE